MGETKYNYTINTNQPQKVAGITFDKKEGVITERELKNLKKDAYGASLLEKGLLVIGEKTTASNTEEVPKIETANEE